MKHLEKHGSHASLLQHTAFARPCPTRRSQGKANRTSISAFRDQPDELIWAVHARYFMIAFPPVPPLEPIGETAEVIGFVASLRASYGTHAFNGVDGGRTAV
jgi:hypothetical protein